MVDLFSRLFGAKKRREGTDLPIILVFPFNFLSHYLRCLALADFFRCDYDFLFCDSEEYAVFVKKAGFKTFPCFTWDGATVLSKLKNFDFSWLDEGYVQPAFDSAVAAIERYQPFVVIGDNFPVLKMAADLKKVPYISILNGYMSKYYAGLRPLSRRHPMYPMLSWLPRPLKDPLVRIGEGVGFRKIQHIFNKVRECNGLVANKTYFDELEGDLNLICDVAELFPQKSLPPKYVILGPLIYGAPDPPEFPLPRLDPTKRTLFVCMGSTGDWDNVSFLSDPYYRRYNIVAAGDRRSVLGTSCVASYEFLNASWILPRTDLVICHGGNGIVNLCICYKVPIVCLTAYFEQEWNALAVEERGWGKSLDGYTDQSELRQVIDEWSQKKFL